MSRKLSLLSSIILLSYTFLNAQTKEELLSFYNQFEPVEFDLLHVYTDGRQEKAIYNPKSSYPFKGKAILPSMAALLEKRLDLDPNKEFFAIYRYEIRPQIEGLLVRVYDKDMLSNSIYTLVYNHQTQSIAEGVLLASDYQAEGGSGAEQSWLFDFNKDNFPDVLTRSYYDRYDFKKKSDNLEHIHQEESYLTIFEAFAFNSKLVENKDLQKDLEKEFPYRSIQAPFVKEKTQKEILKLLKKSGLVIPSETD